jgi:hypothetical protein
MKISEQILSEWKEIKGPQDAAKLAELTNVHRSYINRALRGGEVSEWVFVEIAKFYRAKKKRLQKMLSG